MREIKEERSPVYGDGFRWVYGLYAKLGLNKLLAHVKKHQRLPK